MPNVDFQRRNRELLTSLKDSRQLKEFYYLQGALGPTARIDGIGEVIVLCSNNYLGLANHPEVVAAGVEGLKSYGAGTSSVRFICGSLACHQQLETTISRFVGTAAALSYVSCWNANEAVFPTLSSDGDVVLSDALNHASIIDGCRLMGKNVKKAVYQHSDMDDLETKLQEHSGAQCRWIVSDGVFSMEGDVARLPELISLGKEYDALLVVDDSHGIGALGATGRGTPEYFDQLGEIDILTGTLGKALGGAAGGYVAGSEDAIAVLEQRARPSLFSNALPATVACSARKAIEILTAQPELVTQLHHNVGRIREGLANLGFDCPPSPTAIIPIMIGDAADAIQKSEQLLKLGVMVIGFAYPVVPKGEARLRVQVSAALQESHLEKVLDAFAKL